MDSYGPVAGIYHEPSAFIRCGEFVDSVKNVFHIAVLTAVATEAQDISGLAVSSQNSMFVTNLS
jgi:hypothetical protein